MSWRVILLVGSAYGLFAALVSFAFTRATGLSLWTLQADASAAFGYIVAMNGVLWGSWALFAPAVIALGRRFRFDRREWRRALLVHVPASLVVTSAHIVLVASGRFALQTAWGVNASWGANVYDAFFRTLDFELPVYWALVGVQHALDYYREAQARDIRAAHLETRLVEAQLQALQHQLHPHFLFNALHAISALVRPDPDKAEDAIERLSDLLRITLNKAGVQEVPLHEELAHLRAYLDVEQVQFGSRLQVEYDIDAATLEGLVPALILQPLAENAVRHGFDARQQVWRLSVRVAREGEWLLLQVRDNGRGLSRSSLDSANQGIGLNNLRSRLDRLYHGGGRLAFEANPGGGLVAMVTLPFRQATAHSLQPTERAS